MAILGSSGAADAVRITPDGNRRGNIPIFLYSLKIRSIAEIGQDGILLAVKRAIISHYYGHAAFTWCIFKQKMEEVRSVEIGITVLDLCSVYVHTAVPINIGRPAVVLTIPMEKGERDFAIGSARHVILTEIITNDNYPFAAASPAVAGMDYREVHDLTVDDYAGNRTNPDFADSGFATASLCPSYYVHSERNIYCINKGVSYNSYFTYI